MVMSNQEEEADGNGHLNGGAGRENGAEGQQQLRRGAFRALIQDFSPTWFTWCMNSGAIAELLHQNPDRFAGIDILADIFFVIALVTWLIFSLLFIARLAWFKSAAYYEIVDNVGELTFVSCWAIAFMTLTSCVALIVSTASWGGYSFTVLGYVMWWFVQTWNACLLFWVFTTLFRRHQIAAHALPMSIIIPAVSVSTIGLTGAVVSTYSEAISARLAVPVMILSFQWIGVGILFGLILSSYLFHGLLLKGWPAAEATPTLFILVGPMGQSAAGLQILASGASTYGRFGAYDSGTFITAEAAKALAPACTLIALMLNGLGTIWMFFGILAVVERAWKRELRWTPIWNAAIFPNATLTTSMLAFAIDFDSPAYRAITDVMICILVLLYLVNLVYTILRISQGKLLVIREDWRVKKALEDGKTE